MRGMQVVYRTSEFMLYDLGSLDDYPETSPACLNDKGTVVGNSCRLNPDNAVYGDTLSCAFIWQSSHIQPLGSQSKGSCSEAYGINNNNEVVGDAFPCDAQLSSRYAFVKNGTSLVLLSTLGGKHSTAHAINNHSEIVGGSEIKPGDEMQHACMWRGNKVFDLGSLNSGVYSRAISINDHSQVVGESGQQAFIWQDGKIQPLKGLTDAYSSANCINNNGCVVGQSSGSQGKGHAFLWYAGTITVLGTEDSRDNSAGEALCINDANQVVGWVKQSRDLNAHAVSWQNNHVTDLNKLLPSPLEWHLEKATWINNHGDIVGTAVFENVTHGFLIQRIR